MPADVPPARPANIRRKHYVTIRPTCTCRQHPPPECLAKVVWHTLHLHLPHFTQASGSNVWVPLAQTTKATLPAGAPNAHIGTAEEPRKQPEHPAACRRSGRQQAGQRGRGPRGRAGGAGGRGGPEGARHTSQLPGAEKQEQQQQRRPWCEVLLHPLWWDDSMRGMQFFRLAHTRLAATHIPPARGAGSSSSS